MERIATLLEKIRELNSKTRKSAIEVDLMMDYTRVLYADLLEWRNKIAFTDAVTLPVPPPSPQQVASSFEENKPPQTPVAAAPSVELDATAVNYKTETPGQNPIFRAAPDPHYSGADIRQQIGINDKYQFISELFGNNKDAYEEVINEINTFDTEEDAIRWLNSVSGQFHWNDDSEAVQGFYKLISDFFATR